MIGKLLFDVLLMILMKYNNSASKLIQGAFNITDDLNLNPKYTALVSFVRMRMGRSKVPNWARIRNVKA